MLKKIALSAAVVSVFCSLNSTYAGGEDDKAKSTILLKNEVNAPNVSALAEKKEETEETSKKFTGLRYSGYARLWLLYRNLDKYYNETPLDGLTLPISITQDDGANEPLMLFRIEGNPSAKTWFQMEWLFDHRMLRYTPTQDTESAEGRLAKVYRIFQFKGGTYTNFGNFSLTAGGGVNWYKLSPFTLWNWQYRDDMFERYPWEPEGSDWGRYDSFYSLGDIPRDQRWGNKGTQGFILEGTGLPLGFDAAILYGKNENSGGFGSFKTSVPQNMISGRLGKRLGAHKVGVNYFNQFGYNNDPNSSTALYQQPNKKFIEEVVVDGETYLVPINYTSQAAVTADARINLNGVKIYTEVGAGSYLNGNFQTTEEGVRENGYVHDDIIRKGATPGEEVRYKREWDPMAFLELSFDKSLTKLPIKLTGYYIGKNYANPTSNVFNTSIEQVKQGPDQPNANNTTYYDGMVTQIGQITNNRWAVMLNTHAKVERLKIDIGYAAAQEIENLYDDTRNGQRDSVRNSITFPHLANRLARSRFSTFQRFSGPYNRVQSLYRRTFENLAITDTVVDYKKSFTSLELQFKYKLRLFQKELIMAFFTSYNSVQDKNPFVPVFNDDAFLRHTYYEWNGFYALNSKVTILGFLSLETAKGNKRTELVDENGDLITEFKGDVTYNSGEVQDFYKPVYDPNGKPIDQIGYGYGIGVDYSFAKRASLNWRNRWYSHKDKNHTKDEFRGFESYVELKVFF